jgi:hypothetical protein
MDEGDYLRDGLTVGRSIIPQSLIVEAHTSVLDIIKILSLTAFERAEGCIDRGWFALVEEK